MCAKFHISYKVCRNSYDLCVYQVSPVSSVYNLYQTENNNLQGYRVISHSAKVLPEEKLHILQSSIAIHYFGTPQFMALGLLTPISTGVCHIVITDHRKTLWQLGVHQWHNIHAVFHEKLVKWVKS